MREEWNTYILREDKTSERENIYRRVYVRNEDELFFLESVSESDDDTTVVDKFPGKIEPVEKEVVLKVIGLEIGG